MKGITFSPINGISVSDAEELIAENLNQNSIPGDPSYVKGDIKVTEITVKQTWEENRTQLFFSEYENRIIVFQDGKLTGIFKCGHVYAIYLADLNNDGKYEIIVNDANGNGHINSCIRVFDIENLKGYVLDQLDSDKGEDLLLATDGTGNYLVVYQGRFIQMPRTGVILTGHLLLKDNQLIVEGDAGEIVLIGESIK